MTISRALGADGSKIAELLSESLTVPCFGYSLLDKIAEEIGINKSLMDLIDEKGPAPLDRWSYSAVTHGKVSSREQYYRLMSRVISSIAKGGAVIIGRGANLILAHEPRVFRVRIEGSLDTRAKRVAERQGISIHAAKEFVVRFDKEQKQFSKEIYKIHPTQRTHYELLLSSDDIERHAAVDIIIHAMEKMGYYVPGSSTIKQQGL
ncbi:MAG: cytidylate kinase-like family protein [Magnetococcus sp. DMHC-1]|nr:cytidylate kinase-like family protein [Magnetococcales bacterium]